MRAHLSAEALKMIMHLKAIDFPNFLLAKNYLLRQFWNPNTYTDVQFSAPIDHHSLLLQSTKKAKHTAETHKLEAGLVQPQPCTLLNDLCPEHPLCLCDTSLIGTGTSREKPHKAQMCLNFSD